MDVEGSFNKTLSLDTATSACRRSECPQTFGVKGLTYESLLSADIRMYNFGRSEALNSISLRIRKNFLAKTSINKNHGNSRN